MDETCPICGSRFYWEEEKTREGVDEDTGEDFMMIITQNGCFTCGYFHTSTEEL